MKRLFASVRISSDDLEKALSGLSDHGIEASGGPGTPREAEGATITAEVQVLEDEMSVSARRELLARMRGALEDVGIGIEEAGFAESADSPDASQFTVRGAVPDGRTAVFFARDWGEFDRQFETAFGRQRTDDDVVEVESPKEEGSG
ncbi:hypothetical protein [Sinomonas humi]|uniref:Uncharacterized protein n=1 Tax=Sinomonas humi TaxID=1338436 RepID=A0A0B2AT06_9MICC|nr:hypothetical protein [Sinomonas humi]KHL05125.1 hypothetical protein LK10_02315 [Sinomonas humi]